uniref:DUF2752 domain-containing protein n=1 Tax=Candidatus Stercorousia sp. TaxID=3048886 RepID=UPI004027859E
MRYFKYCLPLIFILVVELLVKFNDKSICLWKVLTGHECIGCGITRAFHALFHLQFQRAFEFNHGIIIVAPLLLYLWIKLILTNDVK